MRVKLNDYRDLIIKMAEEGKTPVEMSDTIFSDSRSIRDWLKRNGIPFNNKTTNRGRQVYR